MKAAPSTHDSPVRLWLANPVLAGVLLATAVFLLYWPATRCEFSHFDDKTYYVENAQVQSGLNGASLLWAFTTGTLSNWHPLTWLSYMADVEMFGGTDPAGPHFTNILFHAANSVLLFWLLRSLTGAHWRSLFVAGLFACHPLNVESVAWVAERKNVLSTLFWLLTVWAYARYAQAAIGHRPSAIKNYWLALACFALGLMSKPMLVTLPFTLLLLDYWPLGRLSSFRFQVSSFRFPLLMTRFPLLLEKLPFFLLAAGSCLVTFFVQQQDGALQSMARFPLSIRVENALVSYWRYLGKTFWPVDLAVAYPHPGHWPVATVGLASTLLLVVSLIALGCRRQPWLLTGWFWFLGTLIPVIGLVQTGIQSMADRYAYVPLVGIFIGVTWGACQLLAGSKTGRAALGLTAVMILTACFLQTRQQLGFWQNDGTLFSRSLAVTTNNTQALVTLGVYLESHGDKPGALKNYRAAEAIDPNDKNAHFDLGNLLDDLGQPEAAIQEYRETFRADPAFYAAHYNLGLLLMRLGRQSEAIAEFQATLKLKPDLAAARQQLAEAGVAPPP